MKGSFSGDPRVVWLTDPNAADRNMRLLAVFSFEDPHQKVWYAPEGMETDGASIPKPLWSLIGSPFTGDYRRAALVHDQACKDALGDRAKRRAADRMFYHACRAGGCGIRDSIILYIGVRIGSVWGLVAAWENATREMRPRLSRTSGDLAMESDFQATADEVLADGETDDIDEIERRTDVALSKQTGMQLSGL